MFVQLHQLFVVAGDHSSYSKAVIGVASQVSVVSHSVLKSVFYPFIIRSFFSTLLDRRSIQEELSNFRRIAAKSLTFDNPFISEWMTEKLMIFNAFKADSSFYQRVRLPGDYPFNYKLLFSSTLNIVEYSITNNHLWTPHISTTAK